MISLPFSLLLPSSVITAPGLLYSSWDFVEIYMMVIPISMPGTGRLGWRSGRRMNSHWRAPLRFIPCIIGLGMLCLLHYAT